MQNLVLISRFAVQYSCKPSDDIKCVARCWMELMELVAMCSFLQKLVLLHCGSTYFEAESRIYKIQKYLDSKHLTHQ